jgi:hypothetical protein
MDTNLRKIAVISLSLHPLAGWATFKEVTNRLPGKVEAAQERRQIREVAERSRFTSDLARIVLSNDRLQE